MYKLSVEERDALGLIMSHIEDYDSCNIEIYDSVVHHNQALNYEQYYNSTHTYMHCFKYNLGNHPLEVALTFGSQEEMSFLIYPKGEDGRWLINFMYNFDDSNSDEEWYEKPNNWWADFTIELYDTEEEYFQASTLYDLALEPEENQMFIDFYNAFTQLLIKRIGEKHYGQSTP